MNQKSSPRTEKEELPLSQAADVLLSEARMVLPGIQALFGFQLIAVFNSTFSEKLSAAEQRLHLLAIILVAISIVIIMTPAAYHRQTGTRTVTQQFIDISTRLMLLSVIPLAISICIEVYLISRLILNDVGVSLVITVGLFVLFVIMWFILPGSNFLQRLFGGKA